MATSATPYGLKPVKRADGMPYAGATSQYLIDPAGEATNLFYGQVVIIGADGYIALATGTSTGSTATGNSTSAVVGATQTAAAAFRVVAAVSDLTESNPDILVKFNPGGHQMTNNVGI
jgi:hypothetical protein